MAKPSIEPPRIDLEELNAKDRVLEAEQLRRRFRPFAERFWPRVTNLEYPDNPATRALCAALQAVADGRIKRLLTAIAPGIGKSTMLALYASWRLARRHDWRSIHGMAAAADANRESAKVRRLVTSSEFLWFFPAFTVSEIDDEPELFRPQLALADDEATIQAWATTTGGRYYALGRDTAVTSKRVHEVVIDDPMTAADRRSKGTRDEVHTWLDESLTSRIDGDGPMIIVAQRLDRDDIHARCLASGQGWQILEPAAARDSRGLVLYDDEGRIVWQDDREPDELIAPQMLTREKITGLSKSVRTIQYQQRPEQDSGGGVIARDAWRFYAPKGANPNAPRPVGCALPANSPTIATPDDFDAMVISTDPTFGGTKNENDFNSTQVWGRAQVPLATLGVAGEGSATCYFLVARWHERAKQRAQREAIRDLRKRFPDASVRIENTAGGPGMVEDFQVEGMNDVELLGTGGLGKAARLDNESETVEQGFAFLPIGMADLQYFVDELQGLTVHDDDMDACSQALRFLKVEAGDATVSTLLRAVANMR